MGVGDLLPAPEDRVKSHANARLGFAGRVCLVERVVQDGWGTAMAARAFGISERSVRKWLARYRAEGRAGLRDRSSRPQGSGRGACTWRGPTRTIWCGWSGT